MTGKLDRSVATGGPRPFTGTGVPPGTLRQVWRRQITPPAPPPGLPKVHPRIGTSTADSGWDAVTRNRLTLLTRGSHSDDTALLSADGREITRDRPGSKEQTGNDELAVVGDQLYRTRSTVGRSTDDDPTSLAPARLMRRRS